MSLRISSTDSLCVIYVRFLFCCLFLDTWYQINTHTLHICIHFQLADGAFLGEHPAAMSEAERGCANNNINLSILLYILSLSLLIQYLNRILSTFIVLHVISPYRCPTNTPQLQPNVNNLNSLSIASNQFILNKS